MAWQALIERVNALIGARRFAEAAQCLIDAAAAGDRTAMVELADWRIGGDLVRRDLAAARALLQGAAAKRHEAAALLHTAFLAAGVGGQADWPGALAELRALAPHYPHAARQLGLIGQMEIDARGAPTSLPTPRRLSDAPDVVAIPGFMTPEECAYLIEAGRPVLQPSLVVDPASGRTVPHPVRASDAAMFGLYAEDVAIHALNRRIAAASGTEPGQGEPLQLLRYQAGGEYRAHMDALPGEPNQRIATLLVHLNEDYEGGETRFVRTGLCYKGRTGDALLFANVGADGRADPLSEHAGLPVTSGEKFIASRWIRARAFAFPPPAPLVDL
ncbi:2OG-Fe(II) oxygenase [Sphingosinicella rhizophila]|uniref:2OG-Fe(II) oxygenase n=1 Tax=Sphingosinicella rhizophila TaxID=3050082 RepID=A0ABU3QAW0_9SPHN|nr:2OG-Fe(II) oxygenase [Sphingosinicella sp. GR2756]MDT9600274.1 2OG-Fe(II) oxygenase [Sphingosinicella sp. GR2756]